ncbi:MAG: ATP-binding protein [Zoogloeaceae bacterium]|nr:ATP-binding protein [Zoogloeaceae bacterium]
MALDAWLPIGFKLPDGAETRIALFEGAHWQILETLGGGRALVVQDELVQHWIASDLVQEGTFSRFRFGNLGLQSISSGPSQTICPVSEAKSPDDKVEALAFSLALKATREIDGASALQDALYVEKITRLLPTYTISSRTGDDVVLGYWLTGGASIPATSFRRLRQAMGWLAPHHLRDVVLAAGLQVDEVVPRAPFVQPSSENPRKLEPENPFDESAVPLTAKNAVFELAGRPQLTDFFNEHIIDIVLNRDRYKALGIDFPSAVILHGPPGTGKTFAVERLVDFLGWPSFQIDASSVASPYIHETSKKVAQVFEQAIENAPSVLVIDEMEAFLADREMGSGHHRVEEVAEFLRRIPEAVKNEVLIIAMTNRIDMIDSAIMRRGRFDHVIEVGFASEMEVRDLLENLLASIPKDRDVDANLLARSLTGRPLSDVTFVVREGARLAARAGKDRLDQESLLTALGTTPDRAPRSCENSRRVGFI